MITSGNSNVEPVRMEFIEWCMEDGNVIGEGKYAEMAAKVKKVADGLQKADLTIYYQRFRMGTGFSFYYGEMPSTGKLLPISWQDGQLLRLQTQTYGTFIWPVKDPIADNYFVANVTVNILDPPPGGKPTAAFLDEAVEWRKRDRSNRLFKILEVLTPYAEQVKAVCDISTYRKIAKISPDYPAPLSPLRDGEGWSP